MNCYTQNLPPCKYCNLDFKNFKCVIILYSDGIENSLNESIEVNVRYIQGMIESHPSEIEHFKLAISLCKNDDFIKLANTILLLN